MSRTIVQIQQGKHTFDARADRLDLRDRPYTPRVANLPPAEQGVRTGGPEQGVTQNRGSPISHFTSHSQFHTPSQPGSRLNLRGQTPTLYPSDCAHPDRKRWAYFGFALLLEKLGSAKLPR